jgi:hypothetical protein
MMEKSGMAGALIALSAAAFIGVAIAMPAKKKELVRRSENS